MASSNEEDNRSVVFEEYIRFKNGMQVSLSHTTQFLLRFFRAMVNEFFRDHFHLFISKRLCYKTCFVMSGEAFIERH